MTRRWIPLATVLLLALIPAGRWASAGKPPPPPPPATDPAIVFVDGNEVVVMDADGSGRTTILRKPKGHFVPVYRDPDWSPTGAQIVLASDVQGSGVYVVNRDGTGLRKVVATVSSPTAVSPVWSPAPVPGLGGGDPRIAFTDIGSGGEFDLFLVNLDGTGLTNLSNTPDVAEFYPTWSPSGNRLLCQAFTSAVRDTYGLIDFQVGQYGVNAYGGAFAGRYVRRPAWSKTDEGRIAVEAAMAWPAESTLDLWEVDLANPSAAVNLTTTSAESEFCPTWSSTDADVAFFTRGGGIHAVSMNGLVRRTLSPTGEFPAWRRAP